MSNSEKANSNLQSSEKFMGSPNRKIVRKHNERKLLMRNGSPQRSQKSQESGSRNSRNLKFSQKSPPKE